MLETLRSKTRTSMLPSSQTVNNSRCANRFQSKGLLLDWSITTRTKSKKWPTAFMRRPSFVSFLLILRKLHKCTQLTRMKLWTNWPKTFHTKIGLRLWISLYISVLLSSWHQCWALLFILKTRSISINLSSPPSQAWMPISKWECGKELTLLGRKIALTKRVKRKFLWTAFC